MPTRKLTVEEHDRGHRSGPRGSLIRLKGRWLQAAGFAPGSRVELTAVSPGVIEIRVCAPPQFLASDFTIPIATK